MALAAVSYDPVPVLADFAKRRGITFPLLSDAGSATIRRYGILNTTVPDTHPQFGYPFPGTFVLNRAGAVTARTFEQTYQERDTISSVLVRLGGMVDRPATKLSTSHLAITSYASDAVAAPGTHFSLVLDIAPAPRMHVYAPGAQGYKPITLTIQPQPGLVVRNVQYPPSEIYFFEPLNERVPVFQRPFRLMQDVMLDPSREAEAALKGSTTFTITGTLNYQACDDQICFLPQTVPLSWTISVRPLDRERVDR
jgi:hypothetical protein